MLRRGPGILLSGCRIVNGATRCFAPAPNSSPRWKLRAFFGLFVSLGAEFENPLLVQADILCAVTGASNLLIDAAIRRETSEDFLETRNATVAFYSVTAMPKAE